MRTVEREQRERAQIQHIAETLQQSLLPPLLPKVPGVEVAAHYGAASPNEVGGDFYDVFPLDGRRWGLFVGDVCGKGPSPARLTALARHTLRAAAILGGDPAAVLHDLNAAMQMVQTPEECLFCTVVYAEVAGWAQGTRLILASGGHPPAFVVRPDGAVTRVHNTGPLVGVLNGVKYATVTVDLRPGDAIVFYTDGITEARPGGAEFGEDGLISLPADCRGMAAGELIDCLNQTLARFDPPPRDDVALLTLSVPAG